MGNEHTMLSDEEVLEEQIYQVREALAAIEKQNSGYTGMSPEELWSFVKDAGETRPIDPRLQQILHGHMDEEELKRSLKRLENDLNDLGKSGAELMDNQMHDMSEETQTTFDYTEETDNKGDECVADEDTNQQQLSAFSEFSDE